MFKHVQLAHRFVHYIPEQLEPGVIYVSMDYATAAHLCCCGCGEQVVTPFTPTDWKLTFNGETVSLSPSIGNWNFKCRSHYFIRNSKVVGAEPWENKQIEHGRERDHLREKKHYDQRTECEERTASTQPNEEAPGEAGIWNRIKKRIRKKRR